MTVKIKGVDKVLKNLGFIQSEINQAMDRAVLATAKQVKREAVLSINKQSPGVPGRKKGKTRHVISKPGDAPNTDTGRLAGSVDTSHVKGSQRALVFSDLDYGAYLEFVLNRPWLEPALMAKIGNLVPNAVAQAKKIRGK